MLQAATMTPDDDSRWQAVLARDPTYDGRFVYGVRSTGVFCRPSCPSRKPNRDRVVFFDVPETASAAGYRACKRCRPDALTPPDPRLDLVRRACRAIEAARDHSLTLTELGHAVKASPHHLQRVFTMILGLSPRQYADAVRLGRVKALLRDGTPVTAALYEAGYGSSSRLYERASERMGMTPASYARGGRGARVAYAIVDDPSPAPMGRVLVAATERGVCMVALGDDDAFLEDELRAELPAAEIMRDEGALAERAAAVAGLVAGHATATDLPLDIRATAFQWQVYQRLMAIPAGETRTYGQIAADMDRPKAARAVGRACATNPVSLVVPCHRAVGGDGALHGYRWGLDRKKALLERERSGG